MNRQPLVAILLSLGLLIACNSATSAPPGAGAVNPPVQPPPQPPVSPPVNPGTTTGFDITLVDSAFIAVLDAAGAWQVVSPVPGRYTIRLRANAPFGYVRVCDVGDSSFPNGRRVSISVNKSDASEVNALLTLLDSIKQRGGDTGSAYLWSCNSVVSPPPVTYKLNFSARGLPDGSEAIVPNVSLAAALTSAKPSSSAVSYWQRGIATAIFYPKGMANGATDPPTRFERKPFDASVTTSYELDYANSSAFVNKTIVTTAPLPANRVRTYSAMVNQGYEKNAKLLFESLTLLSYDSLTNKVQLLPDSALNTDEVQSVQMTDFNNKYSGQSYTTTLTFRNTPNVITLEQPRCGNPTFTRTNGLADVTLGMLTALPFKRVGIYAYQNATTSNPRSTSIQANLPSGERVLLSELRDLAGWNSAWVFDNRPIDATINESASNGLLGGVGIVSGLNNVPIHTESCNSGVTKF